MANWHSLGAQDMLAEGMLREIVLDGQAILLARVGERYYATQGRCPHLRGHLARGRLEGSVVTCPVHGSQFDVTTGKNLAWVEGLPGLAKTVVRALTQPRDLVTFTCKTEGGQLWIQI